MGVILLLYLRHRKLYLPNIFRFAQTSWLLPAYMLEFKGNNTFVFIWLEGLAFFCANVGILAKMIRRYREVSSVIEEQCNLQKLD